MAITRTHHNAYTTHYHIVFPVKYRKALLSQPIASAIQEIALRIEERYDITFEKMGTDGNHIHILCSFHPKYAGGYIVGMFKSITARQLFARFPELKNKMIEVHKKWNGDAVLIEGKASGKDVIYELKDATDMPIIAINPATDKVSRAAAVSGKYEAGRIHAPRRAHWLRQYLTELEHFPKAAHDDQVDSTTQAIRWMSRYPDSVIMEASI